TTALLTSLVLALFFTPVLARRFVFATKHQTDGPLMQSAIGTYERLLNLALRNTRLVLILIAALLGLSYFLYRILGSEFLPEFDEGAFILDYVAPPGASLAETDRILRHVEAMLKETPDVESFSRRTGMQLGLAGVTEPNTGDFAVKLRDSHRAPEEIMSEL